MSQAELSFEPINHVKVTPLQCDIPRPYQQEAVEAVVNVFEQHSRTHIVMACGTGKTRVALWVAERLDVKNIVVFVPSLALVRQLMEEWLKITVWPSVSCLAVCSDETVTHSIDSIIVDPRECDFPVTTHPKEIHRFLKNKTNNVKVVFCTYHSSAMLAEGMQGCEPFDYGVFDEAHRTTGRSYFGLGVDNQAIPIQKRLFMTATPKHYNINKKNRAGDAKLVYSMDSEVLYGPRAYTLSFRKAINLGIITDYKIMISVISDQQALTEESELDGQIVALRKAVLKDPNIAKVITFHQTIDEARSFSFHIQDKHDSLPGFTHLHVNSRMTSHSRHDIMRTFQKSDKSIISNARCLTEGIDVPAVDMVAFLNAKKSKIDIVQAIGRAMRKAPGKTYGYVFLPLFVEQNAGESIQDAILRGNYENIWEVVQAFSEQDEDLRVTIENLKQQKGKTGELAPGLEKYLEIISYDDVNISLQEQLKQVVSIAIIDKIPSNWHGNWHEMYGKLMLFKELHRHTNVSKSYQDKSLKFWVCRQRDLYKNNSLSYDKVKLLEAIGFEWNPHEACWYLQYEKLKVFKAIQQHCNVPKKYQQDKRLGGWVNVQRQFYRNNRLSENKIKLLEAIGFEWDLYDAIWRLQYEKLKAFNAIHKHCDVPRGYQQDTRFGNWVGTQRQHYKNGKLSENKIKLLEAIGFEWNPHEVSWYLQYEKLKAFNATYKHCNVPFEYQQNKCLGRWVAKQRDCYKNSKLSANKIKLLKAVGFEWDPYDAIWHLQYEKLKAFNATHKHCNVPREYQQDKRFGVWVGTQRQHYKNGKLSENKIKLLEAIGFEWDPLDTNWHLHYEMLKAFKALNNHCNVPESCKDKTLMCWVQSQRRLYKQKRLSAKRVMLLEAIEFKWNLRDTRWDHFYEKLKAFKAMNNHCNVPKSYQDKSLAYWIARQRQKNVRLSADKAALLNAIGFEWKQK